jgi:hypothetical protein
MHVRLSDVLHRGGRTMTEWPKLPVLLAICATLGVGACGSGAASACDALPGMWQSESPTGFDFFFTDTGVYYMMADIERCRAFEKGSYTCAEATLRWAPEHASLPDENAIQVLDDRLSINFVDSTATYVRVDHRCSSQNVLVCGFGCSR